VRRRHARFEALLPPGVRSATTPRPGQAGVARRCSPGVLSLQSSLHYGSGFGLSRRHSRGAKPRSANTSGRPAIAVALRDPDSDAWAREPRIRRHAGSREPRTSPSGSGPAHGAPLERSVRQPPAPSRALPGVEGRSVLPVPPLGGTPRLPALGDRFPWRGRDRWTSKTLVRRTVHQLRPSRGGLATEPLAELGLVPRRRVDPGAPGFRQPPRFVGPAPSRGAGHGGPPCRQVGRLSWDFVPRRLDSMVRASSGASLFAFRTRPFRAWRPTGASPRVRRPVAGSPLSRAPPQLSPRRTPSRTLQSPTRFRAPGCPSSRFVSVTELG